ncbi:MULTISPECIES: ankyrin repeat domain-containing protein [unclassified Mycobacterium]|uniref:ankyrin repeat domain-containing protein n=1 Tax=unclassified Mycobacterium TaxID=2642494 RepID=UPI00048C1C8A|nr:MULTISPECIES: ankyrin repeat domain-containing protein [unclassified Mycobacterium]SEB24555.1 Ankyrin repeat-containing protein [Mycobacterium sp. 283mftsu]
MASTLPTNPSLDKLRVEARQLQRADGIALHAAQFAVARRYGFTGWPALVHYLRLAADLSVDPGAVDEDALDPADRFCSWASLRYNESDAPPRWQSAAELLAADPGLVDRSIWAAAAASDPVALADHLAHRPTLAGAGGGPFGWVPMMYLCYSRVPLGRSANDVLAVATLLLDAGADPNDGYLWCGMSTPFTLLTGVFGEGEQGPRRQPRHPYATELATLLLRRGAHPVDQQTLYNRMFRPDDSHLELLFAHGLADAGPSPWERQLGEAMETREQLWQRQIHWAAEHGFRDRLDLLARHGIDVSGVELVTQTFPDDPNARDDEGATPLHQAAWEGDLPLIRRLLAAGADPSLTDGRFESTPLQWAEHAYQTEAAELLRAATSATTSEYH